MKKLNGILSVAFGTFVLPCVCMASNVDLYGDLNIRPERDSVGRMYMGLRGDLSFLSWKNTYKDEAGTKLDSDSFSLKPVVGVDVFFGGHPAKNWRADLEFGYTGKCSETETEYYLNYPTEKTEFNLETIYTSVNGYYDFWRGVYVGAGAGIAIVKTSIESSVVTDKSATNFSPMGALMFGWSYKLDEKINLDLRYRFSLYEGGDLDLDTGGGTEVKTEVGLIKDNTVSVGIRYSF